MQLHQPGKDEHEASLLLRRRSLNVICDEAYEHWHGIAEALEDIVDDRVANTSIAKAKVGDIVARRERVSIVFVRKLDGQM
mmetsp:Transcript_23224/g.71156  ORF Transcript_23224/g.71156 Transcript_23224/m.71156 type:complete len:81 (+) Transcript_23224:140-382(+)